MLELYDSSYEHAEESIYGWRPLEEKGQKRQLLSISFIELLGNLYYQVGSALEGVAEIKKILHKPYICTH